MTRAMAASFAAASERGDRSRGQLATSGGGGTTGGGTKDAAGAGTGLAGDGGNLAGDGGSANRVVAFETPSNRVLWATPAFYANPHSIALHDASQLLVVADREHSQLRRL